jgi:cytochrome c-type biogenesis protein CcmH
MSGRILLAAALALLFLGRTAPALEPSEELKNPVLEARAEAIGRELRCLVCQNESIEASDAPLAHDLRLLIRRRLAAGESDKDVIAYIVSRYGIFVLLDPPFLPVTYLLWLTPPALLLGAGAFLFLRARRGRREGPVPELSREERARAARLLGEEP